MWNPTDLTDEVFAAFNAMSIADLDAIVAECTDRDMLKDVATFLSYDEECIGEQLGEFETEAAYERHLCGMMSPDMCESVDRLKVAYRDAKKRADRAWNALYAVAPELRLPSTVCGADDIPF